jgi:hypothetical protein
LDSTSSDAAGMILAKVEELFMIQGIQDDNVLADEILHPDRGISIVLQEMTQEEHASLLSAGLKDAMGFDESD